MRASVPGGAPGARRCHPGAARRHGDRTMAADGVQDTEATRAEYTRRSHRPALRQLAGPGGGGELGQPRAQARPCQELGRVVASEHADPAAIWQALREFCDIPKGELYISREEAEGIRVSLLSYYISSQLPFIGIAKNHVTIRDIDTVLGHTIGHVDLSGKLGGKAAGMIVAQKILLPILCEREPDFEKYIAVPDTWYISSGVMSDFIDRNHFYDFHTHKYRDRDAIDEEYKRVGGLFEKAAFPPDVVEEFRDPDPPDRGASHHRALLQLPGGQLRTGLLGEIPVHLPCQPGRRGAAAGRVHPGGKDRARKHVRPGSHHLPPGSRPAGLQRAHGHDRAEGRGTADSATGSFPLPPGSCTPPTPGCGTPGSERRTAWCGSCSGWEPARWTGSAGTIPA